MINEQCGPCVAGRLPLNQMCWCRQRCSGSKMKRWQKIHRQGSSSGYIHGYILLLSTLFRSRCHVYLFSTHTHRHEAHYYTWIVISVSRDKVVSSTEVTPPRSNDAFLFLNLPKFQGSGSFHIALGFYYLGSSEISRNLWEYLRHSCKCDALL